MKCKVISITSSLVDSKGKYLFNICFCSSIFTVIIAIIFTSSSYDFLTFTFTLKDDFAQNREFITLVVYKTNGKKVYYPGKHIIQELKNIHLCISLFFIAYN